MQPLCCDPNECKAAAVEAAILIDHHHHRQGRAGLVRLSHTVIYVRPAT